MRARLYLLTFLNSCACILVQRGVFFYARKWLGFSDATNLLLAMLSGLAYIAGAWPSHFLVKRIGERRLLCILLGVQLVVFLFLTLPARTVGLFLGTVAFGILNGMTWPVVESYVMAGLAPGQSRTITGRFNLSWSLAIPTTLIVAGPVIGAAPWAIFVLGAGLTVLVGVLARTLRARPAHLPDDHPERPTRREALRVRGLMISARWQLLTSYATMWILAALMPTIFQRLGYGAQRGAGLSSAMDVARIASFAAMYAWSGWQGRIPPLLVSIVLLPTGFLLVLFGESLPVVLLGEALFGAMAGLIYCASFCYAMVVKNASVEAGGGHESLIGLGFAAGPATGLLSLGAAPYVGGKIAGMFLGVGPMLAVCSAGALRPLVRIQRMTNRSKRK
jgi:MFS family permease